MTSPLALLIIFIILPTLGASMLAAARSGELGSERAEKTALFYMMMLPVFGLMAVMTTKLIPLPISPIPPLFLGESPSFDGPAGPLEPTASVDMLAVFAWGAVYFILMGILFELIRFARQRFRLVQIIQQAEWRQGVLYTEESVPPFAWDDRLVVLPQSLTRALTDEDLDLIIAHERTHIQRRDGRWFAALALIDALFWFNPAIRKQTAKCRQAAERSVDEFVLTNCPSRRKAYASSLITVLEFTAGRSITAAASMSAGSIEETKMRLKRIMGHKDRAGNKMRSTVVGIAAAALFAQGAVAAVLFTSPSELSVIPVKGVVTSPFGKRFDPISDKKNMHRGIDIKAKKGTPVLAAGGGVVTFADYRGGYGKLVEIDHGAGLFTRYAQLEKMKVSVGDRVTAGQKIATVGSSGRSTGPHLHFEVIAGGKNVDPAAYLEL